MDTSESVCETKGQNETVLVAMLKHIFHKCVISGQLRNLVPQVSGQTKNFLKAEAEVKIPQSCHLHHQFSWKL